DLRRLGSVPLRDAELRSRCDLPPQTWQAREPNAREIAVPLPDRRGHDAALAGDLPHSRNGMVESAAFRGVPDDWCDLGNALARGDWLGPPGHADPVVAMVAATLSVRMPRLWLDRRRAARHIVAADPVDSIVSFRTWFCPFSL